MVSIQFAVCLWRPCVKIFHVRVSDSKVSLLGGGSWVSSWEIWSTLNVKHEPVLFLVTLCKILKIRPSDTIFKTDFMWPWFIFCCDWCYKFSNFFGSFEECLQITVTKMCLLALPFLFLCLHGTSWEQLNGFSWHFELKIILQNHVVEETHVLLTVSTQQT
jgi:hypothetical protein